MDPQPTLLVLAAGMGSRYGGLKQLDPVGPAGEVILDYSIHDAVKAGFSRVIFVIRRDIEGAFRKAIGRRYEGKIEVAYAFQERGDLPEGFAVPEDRTRPWGTGHAMRAARHLLETPFAVINADDFYGAEAYTVMARALRSTKDTRPLPLHMVGYRLDHTLSPHGSVNRGLCQCANQQLQSVREIVGIQRDPSGVLTGQDASGATVTLQPDNPVSMNFWGFPPSLCAAMEPYFREFLEQNRTTPNAEFYLPALVDQLIRDSQAVCTVLPTEADWFGITYPEDKPRVEEALRQRIQAGQYRSPLET